VSPVSYELRALAGRCEITAQAAPEAHGTAVELPQGYGLLPITDHVLERLGGADTSPFGEVFWFLSAGVEALARRISLAGDIAYVEAEFFGGNGTQAMVLWRGGEVCLGPITAEFPATAQDPSSSPQWPFNRALRELGVDRGDAFDEFDALGLGRWRHTDEWPTTGTTPDACQGDGLEPTSEHPDVGSYSCSRDHHRGNTPGPGPSRTSSVNGA